MNKHAKLLHKVEVVPEEKPIRTEIPAVGAPEVVQVEETIKPAYTIQPSGEMLGMSIESTEDSGGSGWVMWVVAGLLAVVAGLVVGGVVYLSKNRSTLGGGGASPTVVPTVAVVDPSPTKAVMPTPTPAVVDLSKLKVQVLNGSGVKGEARVAVDLLKELKLASVDTGNADKFDYGQTVIKYKANVDKGLVEKVKQAIAGKYKISDDGGDLELATVSKYDVVVILGKEKN